MQLTVFLTAIGGDGYLIPSKTSARMSDEPLISEACYLMQRCEVSFKRSRRLVKEELRMFSKRQQQAQERQYSAVRNIYPLEEKRPVSALHGLLDAIPDQPEAKPLQIRLLQFQIQMVLTYIVRHPTSFQFGACLHALNQA
jgi:hypothetical protein